MGTISVDPELLHAAAARLEDAADILSVIPAAADDAMAGVARWARSAREVAAVLRLGAERYLAGEADAVTALR